MHMQTDQNHNTPTQYPPLELTYAAELTPSCTYAANLCIRDFQNPYVAGHMQELKKRTNA